jgi:hypothetical protein
MDEAVRARQVRAAMNQSLFREVNERIGTIAAASDEPIGFVCECLDIECNGQIWISLSEYETIRQSGSDRFFVLPRHNDPEVEDLVGEHTDYAVVKKIDEAAAAAAALDRRAAIA